MCGEGEINVLIIDAETLSKLGQSHANKGLRMGDGDLNWNWFHPLKC